MGSALIEDGSVDANKNFITFESRGGNRFEASKGLARPTYLLAVASDKPLVGVSDSLFIAESRIEESLIELPRLRAEQQILRAEFEGSAQNGRKLEAELKQLEVALEHFPPDLGRYPYPAWRK